MLRFALMRVSVVVLGDLARSPRMVNHAHSLASREVAVDLIGYGGRLPHTITANPLITSHVLPDLSSTNDRRGARWMLAAGLRGLRESWNLLRRLLSVPRPDVILVQTPPAVPTLAVAFVAARLRSARLVIDWHNLTSTLVQVRVGPRHPAVAVVAWYERVCGRLASAGFCVSTAMRDRLAASGIEPLSVLRDRPSDTFAPASSSARSAVRASLTCTTPAGNSTPDRVVVMPSSWSEDDDVSLLLEAVERCESLIDQRERDRGGRPFPTVALVLTGDGPVRARFLPRITSRVGRRIHVSASWFDFKEYVTLIGSADLGVSVHRSTSGVDLPMKICDLFGGGVPVCALNYGPCLAELVGANVNGALFRDADELAVLLRDLLDDTPEAIAGLASLRDGALVSRQTSWQAGWDAEAWPVIRGTTA